MMLVAPDLPPKQVARKVLQQQLTRTVCSQQEASQSIFSFLLIEALELEFHVLNLLSLYFYFPTDRLNVLNWVIRIWR